MSISGAYYYFTSPPSLGKFTGVVQTPENRLKDGGNLSVQKSAEIVYSPFIFIRRWKCIVGKIRIAQNFVGIWRHLAVDSGVSKGFVSMNLPEPTPCVARDTAGWRDEILSGVLNKRNISITFFTKKIFRGNSLSGN